MRTVVVIPARLASTRLPGKVLADIGGKPLLWHVWSRCQRSHRTEQVLIAAGCEDVAQAAMAWGARVIIASGNFCNGTERIASILPQIDAEIIVNVQADQPFLEPAVIDALVDCLSTSMHQVSTPVFRIRTKSALLNPHVVKVVRSAGGRALYFSRSPIPFTRDVPMDQWIDGHVYWGHVGVYAFRRSVLEEYPQLPGSRLEEAESLEQLRLLEAGIPIWTIETPFQPLAIDTPTDLEDARKELLKRNQPSRSKQNASPLRNTT